MQKYLCSFTRLSNCSQLPTLDLSTELLFILLINSHAEPQTATPGTIHPNIPKSTGQTRVTMKNTCNPGTPLS
jgi:hypothetical protein